MAEPIYRDLTPEELESFTSQNTQSNSKQQSYRDLTEEELKNIEFKKESVGFGENVYRTVGGALRDTAQATTELIEDVTGADIPDLPTVAEPTYLGGSVLRDIAGFAVPYAGIAKGVSALSKLNKLSKAKKILQPTTTPGKIGKAAVVGATAVWTMSMFQEIAETMIRFDVSMKKKKKALPLFSNVHIYFIYH